MCCHPLGHKESDTTEQLNWSGVFNVFSKVFFLLSLTLRNFSLFNIQNFWCITGEYGVNAHGRVFIPIRFFLMK